MIGIILKDLRAEKGMTQVELASSLNVKQSTISSWEIERTSPTLEQLGDLASIFDVSCDYLIGRTKEYQGDVELTAAYRRRMKIQQATYSLGEVHEILQDYIKPDAIVKEKIVNFFDQMSERDFIAFANLIAAYLESKKIKD